MPHRWNLWAFVLRASRMIVKILPEVRQVVLGRDGERTAA